MTGCSTKNNSLKKLTLVLGGCNGICPYLSIEIDSSGTYKYYCLKNCDSTGHFVGKVSDHFIDSLSSKLSQTRISETDTSFEYNRSSVYVEFVVHYQTRDISVKGSKDELPIEIQDFIDLIIAKSKVIEFRRNLDTNTWQTEIPIPLENYFSLPYPDK